MAAVSCLLHEHQFLCSICLDVFTDPVTTSCGHNFCNCCITEHFNVNVPYLCPMCKEVFHTRPQLKINTLISEMMVQFRQEVQKRANSSGMCMKHDKPLELFCKTDHTCICLLCPVLDHKNHECVPLREEYEEQKANLKKTEAEIQQMIQERQLKIQEIQHSVDLSKKAADRETAEGVEVFTALMESVQTSLNLFKEEIQEKQRTTEKQAEGFIKELEEEISDLKNRSTEVEQLSGSEDHLHFVQRLTSIKAAPSMKTWTKVSVHPPSYEGTVVRAVSQLENKLREDMKKVIEADLKRVQKYEVDVTLDPDSANPWLVLSEDEKQVICGDVKNNLPETPQRFSLCCNVLGKQRFSSGRFYFEVQVTEKSGWALGVVRESVDRKVHIALSPQNGYWTIWLRNGNEYCAPSVRLSLKPGPQKVGVFVDYEEGLVTFCDVDSSVLIYSFIGCRFNGKLLPFFSPCRNDGGKNSAPLIITPVRRTE